MVQTIFKWVSDCEKFIAHNIFQPQHFTFPQKISIRKKKNKGQQDPDFAQQCVCEKKKWKKER